MLFLHAKNRPGQKSHQRKLVVSATIVLSVFMFYFQLSRARGAEQGIRVATASRSMVATVSPLATDAAVEVLRGGGNAVDAAVAAASTLGVVDSSAQAGF